MEIRKCDQLTDLPTDGLTWVGARDTCVSKKRRSESEKRKEKRKSVSEKERKKEGVNQKKK